MTPFRVERAAKRLETQNLKAGTFPLTSLEKTLFYYRLWGRF